MVSSCPTCRVVLLMVALAGAALADVRLPSIISNHMVLQAGSPVSVWGWADPAEEVSVTLAGRTGTVTTSAAGKWEVKFPPLAVRYGWADNPQCSLYNRAGLPLAPFRTDSW